MLAELVRLSRHSVIYGLGAALGQVVGFLLIPLNTAYLSPSDYGVLEVLLATISVLGVILGMGVNTALLKSYVECPEDRRKEVTSTTFFFLTILSASVIVLLVLMAGWFSSLLLGSEQYTRHFQMVFGTVFFDTGSIVALSLFRARQEPGKFAVAMLARLVIAIGLTVFFLVGLERGVLGVIEAGFIASAMVYVALAAGVIRQAGFAFSSQELRKMLAFGVPLVPAGLAAWVLTMADRYFLQFLSTSEELGLYSLGYRFGMVINVLIASPFILAWIPFIFHTVNRENAREIYSRSLTYFFLFATFAALALSMLGQEAIAIMARPAFQGAYKVIPLIAFSYVLYGCYMIFAVGINLEAKTKYLALIAGAVAVLNCLLNYLLIPSYGMMGAAAATLLCYALLPVGSYLVSRRYYEISYEWARIAKITLAAVMVLTGSLFIVDTYAVFHSYVVVGLLKVLALLTFPFLLYVFRFYRPEEIEKAKSLRTASFVSPIFLGRRKTEKTNVS